MTHWATGYIGEPWVAQQNDCWAFCRRVWRDHFELEVPAVDVDAAHLALVARAFAGHAERANWIEVDLPREGDAVLLAHARYASHVGVWIEADGGGVLHCDQASGVVFSTPQALDRCGWRRLRFYRHLDRQ